MQGLDTDDRHPWLGGSVACDPWEDADAVYHLWFTLPLGHWPLLPRGPDPTFSRETHAQCLSATLS